MCPHVGHLLLRNLVAVQLLQAAQKVTLGHHPLGCLPGNFLEALDDGHTLADHLHWLWWGSEAANFRNVGLVQIGKREPCDL